MWSRQYEQTKHFFHLFISHGGEMGKFSVEATEMLPFIKDRFFQRLCKRVNLIKDLLVYILK